MKTERRHELQTNVLAESLARWIEVVRPYTKVGLAILIALVAALFAWGYHSTQSSRHQADGWDEYFDAVNSRDSRGGLSDVAERYAGTAVGNWARVALADMQLDQGTQLMFSNKGAGREELQKTIEAYQAISLESSQPMLLQRATFGLARAREALGKDLAKAREDYRSIAQKWPDSPYAAAAEARAKDLDRLETKNFYDWFARYEPPRPMSNEPGIPGARPEFMKDQLDDGDLKLPSLSTGQPLLPGLDTDAKPEEASSGDEAAKPAAEERPAADEQPAETSTEKPAEPANEKSGQGAAPKEPDEAEPAPQP